MIPSARVGVADQEPQAAVKRLFCVQVLLKSDAGGLFNDATTKAAVAVVKYHRLSRRYGTLRVVEPNPISAPFGLDGAGLVILAVTGLGGAAEG